ncbi:MAG: isocitrate/isopropylmalate family dehydrogenase, partial [Actinomycetota bacterium]
VLPDKTLEELKSFDVILLGAVGDPSVPSGVLERGLLLKLRFAFDHYINLRPARLYPGVVGPLKTSAPIDFIVVREGTEGPYVGAGGVLGFGTSSEIATEESLNTRRGAERVIRDAFNRAMARPRKRLTLVHKNNVLTRAGSLWTRTFEEVAKDFPQVSTDYLHVDAASMFFVTNPERFDVV